MAESSCPMGESSVFRATIRTTRAAIPECWCDPMRAVDCVSPVIGCRPGLSDALMSYKRRPLTFATAGKRHSRFAAKLVPAFIAAVAVAACWHASCARPTDKLGARERWNHLFPPPPQSVRAVALGNLRRRPASSQFETDLSMFLFGVEPETPLGMVAPYTLATDAQSLLICDSVMNGVFESDLASDVMAEIVLAETLQRPISIEIAPNGDRLIADLQANAVFRFDRVGNRVATYERKNADFRPADSLQVGDEVWVTNAAAHRIEVFDAGSATFKRSIGERGSSAGQFGIPLGLALCPNGDVCVVDVLNSRVQVFAAEGQWKRSIGRPGNRVGCFGRPRDVAVGPDGTVFVVDAASQRVHVFDDAGRPLLAFGEPESGKDALSMPNGIAIATHLPGGSIRLPDGFEPSYFVFVAERLSDPGVRVYAWGKSSGAASVVQESLASETVVAGRAVDPHWSPEYCTACHTMDDDRAVPIRPEKVNLQCLSCHDGVRAHAEPHPIGRPGVGKSVQTPAGWPLVDGRTGCLTCHDIRRHCDGSAVRPIENPAMLRAYHPDRPVAFCLECHNANENWRISPHVQLDPTGRVKKESCAFCHDRAPEVSDDGSRRFNPRLRVESSRICLSCHARHWDYFPEGHVEHPVTQAIRQRMIAHELTQHARIGDRNDERRIQEALSDPNRRPRTLPLSENRVACYTCHNPHQAGLFPIQSELGSFASSEQDSSIFLRLDRTDLCTACHGK